MKRKNIILSLIFYLILSEIFIIKTSAESDINKLIKSICLENLKSEMLKANIKYEDEIGEETCNCYLKNFLEEMNHNNAVNICKIKTKEKYKL